MQQSILSLRGEIDCFAKAGHRARTRATRWLAISAEFFNNCQVMMGTAFAGMTSNTRMGLDAPCEIG